MKSFAVIFAAILTFAPSLALAADQQAKLNVTGMFCSDCVSQVKSALEKTAGVKAADVSMETNSATVKYDDKKTDPRKLANIVTDAGFETTVAR